MPLFLRSEDKPSLAGMTLFSDPRLGQWAKATGIYVPPAVELEKGTVNVLLWLHGWYVPKIEHLFYADPSSVRRQVLSSGKSVVLVAPYLGKGQKGEGSTFSVADLKGSFGEIYLNQVLNTLALGLEPNGQAPWEVSNLTLSGLAETVNPTPRLRLGKLVIGCHSGGGAGMRRLVGALGRYKGNLAECWGFDCLYGANARPDDASFWYDWATGGDGRPVHISYGSSTVPQSVKLDLMARGLATREGTRRDPAGPTVARLRVTLGVPSARTTDDLMGLDALRKAPAPKPGTPAAKGPTFAEQAAGNLRKNTVWPADLMDMHYRIARDGLLERLKGASFL